MSTLSQYKARGRAYQCKRCSKIDRKGRVISHVLKYHVPFDEVPFSCSLCSFRCQEKESLYDHIRKYSRHREEEAKQGVPDYSKVLKKASKPYYVGEGDMTQLTKEDSMKWFNRNVKDHHHLDESEDIYHDDEDDVISSGGLSVPRWLVDEVPAYSAPASVNQPQRTSTVSSFTSTPATFNPIQLQPLHQFSPLIPPNSQFQDRRVFQPIATLAAGLTTINTADVTSLLGQPPLINRPRPVITTPLVGNITPANFKYLSTPCLDENDDDINILPSLMSLDRNDPLFTETEHVDNTVTEPTQKRARLHPTPSTVSSIPPNSIPTVTTTSTQSSFQAQPSYSAPPTSSETTSTNQDVLTKTIMDAAKLIANSIESNTRAIRCQEKTLEKVVGELSRIERKLNQIERNQATKIADPKPPVLKENKVNKTVKSVVSSVKPK